MLKLTVEAERRIQAIPHELHREFPHVGLGAIEHDVEERVTRLAARAHFDDFLPLLVRASVRNRLRSAC